MRKYPSALLLMLIFLLVTFAGFLGFRWFSFGGGGIIKALSLQWTLAAASIDTVHAFPALSLVAIMGVFGLGSAASGDRGKRFSSEFMEMLRKPLLACVVAGSLNALLSLLALPLLLDWRSGVEGRSSLFEYSLHHLSVAVASGAWDDAARRLSVCDTIWPNSPLVDDLEISRGGNASSETEAPLSLRNRIRVELVALRGTDQDPDGVGESSPAEEAAPLRLFAPGGSRAPVNATVALSKAEAALQDNRLFDAHWYATLAQRLSKGGSPMASQAERLAAETWNKIASTMPDEEAAKAEFARKKYAYQATLAGDWIRAYYVFVDLRRRDPSDPELPGFIAQSEAGASSLSFFLDEASYDLGEVYTDVLFSVPEDDGGRDVVFAKKFRAFQDAAYAEGLVAAGYDVTHRRVWTVSVPYAKFIPISTGSPGDATHTSRERSAVLLVGLDRTDEQKRSEPIYQGKGRQDDISTRLMLKAPFEDLLLAASVQRDLSALSLNDLDRAADRLRTLGFRAERFRGETITRLADVFSFLWLEIFALTMAWRLRSRKKFGFSFVLVVLVLFFVLDLAVQVLHHLSFLLSTALVALLPFGAALPVLIVTEFLVFLLAVVLLAAQKSG